MFSLFHRSIAAQWKGRGVSLAIVVLIAYAGITAAIAPDFLRMANINAIVYSATVTLPAVLGMQALIILGKFDLSVGATASLSGMVAALILMTTQNPILATASGVVMGALVGVTNGFLVARLSIDSLIATLATMGIGRSLALVVNDGRIVSGLPESFSWLSTSSASGVPVLVIAALALLIVAHYSFYYTVGFRRFYAVGGNPVAATLAGVRVPIAVTCGYVIAGVGASVTGLVQVSRTISASPLIFQDLALDAIAACVIGGSSLSGGRGTMLGGALGLLVITATRNLVVLSEVTVYWKDG